MRKLLYSLLLAALSAPALAATTADRAAWNDVAKRQDAGTIYTLSSVFLNEKRVGRAVQSEIQGIDMDDYRFLRQRIMHMQQLSKQYKVWGYYMSCRRLSGDVQTWMYAVERYLRQDIDPALAESAVVKAYDTLKKNREYCRQAAFVGPK